MSDKEILRLAYIVHDFKNSIGIAVNREDRDRANEMHKSNKNEFEREWLYDLLKLLDEEVWNI